MKSLKKIWNIFYHFNAFYVYFRLVIKKYKIILKYSCFFTMKIKCLYFYSKKEKKIVYTCLNENKNYTT